MNCASVWGKSLLVLAVTSSCAGPLKADPFDTIREEIQRRLVQQSIPSVAVAVARGEHIIWEEEGFGWADRENRLCATPHTPYALGSVSKPITATAVMGLVERKLLALDGPINDYLDDARIRARIGDASQATLRRVAQHTAGLPGYQKRLLEAGYNDGIDAFLDLLAELYFSGWPSYYRLALRRR
jgi:CubicO group peptidase (beta-lactamase class C family)